MKLAEAGNHVYFNSDSQHAWKCCNSVTATQAVCMSVDTLLTVDKRKKFLKSTQQVFVEKGDEW